MDPMETNKKNKQKFIPDYLEEYSDGLQEVCKKLDLILDAIYGKEADKQIKKEKWALFRGKANADDSETAIPKTRGRKPKE